MNLRLFYLQMVLEVYSSISSLHLPGVRITVRDFILDIVAVPQVKPLASDQKLCNTKSSERERVAKDIRALPVDLSSNDTCSVADSLLEANCGCSAILGCHVDIQPTHVQSWSIVDSDSAEERAQELDAVRCRADDQDIADDTEDVGKCYEWPTNACAIGEPSNNHERETTEYIYRNGKVLGLKGVVTQRLDDTW